LVVGRIDGGALLIFTGFSFFDPLIARAVALWIIVTTGRDAFESHEEPMWPENIVCGHPDHNEPQAGRKLIHTNIKLNYFAMTDSGTRPTCLYVAIRSLSG
jgi:Co/Zn/Cd efflux system component